MLTVGDIAALPELSLDVSAGADGLANVVRWLHVSELGDPTPWLEGGELLMTTGLGVGETAPSQREYVRRLSRHALAGLAFGAGFGFAETPPALVAEADTLGFPVLTVPYEVPFIALTKAVSTHLANEELDRVTRALEVHERLAQTVLEGGGLRTLLAVLGDSVGCSLALVDEAGRVVVERYAAAGPRSFDGGLALPVVAGGDIATLRAAKANGGFTEEDRLVLHHGQTALALELSRRRAVSAAELRLAGDLLEDLEHDRLDDRELARRMAAFGLEPGRPYAALLAVGANGDSEVTRRAVAGELDARGALYVSAARRDRAAFLVAAEKEADALAVAEAVTASAPGTRVGVGRPSSGRALGRSLLEARAALDAGPGPIASYRDLGSLELLLGLPSASLEAFVDRVLGPTADSAWLVDSLTALLDAGCRWSDAATQLGVHRHTLRYRMDRLRQETGRHPDDPAQRMELWLAVKARQALQARVPTVV
jgi:purine catabolism regulator